MGFMRRLKVGRIYEWKRCFLLVGADIFNYCHGLTFGWGPRLDAKEGETRWRNVWRIDVRSPITVRKVH
jgi:hypothetical protein